MNELNFWDFLTSVSTPVVTLILIGLTLSLVILFTWQLVRKHQFKKLFKNLSLAIDINKSIEKNLNDFKESFAKTYNLLKSDFNILNERFKANEIIQAKQLEIIERYISLQKSIDEHVEWCKILPDESIIEEIFEEIKGKRFRLSYMKGASFALKTNTIDSLVDEGGVINCYVRNGKKYSLNDGQKKLYKVIK